MWNPKIETMNREDLQALQLKRLQATVAQTYERVPMYRKRFEEAGLRPEHIKSLADIRLLP